MAEEHITVTGFLARFVITIALAVFLVWWWALRLYAGVDGDGNPLSLNLTVLSVFFNDEPKGWVRDLLLLARGLFGMAAVSWVFIPSWELFADMDFKATANSITGVFVLGSVAAFFGAVIAHYFLYL